MTTRFRNDEEISSLVTEFEACTLDPATFKHYQHLTVALWYLTHNSYATASEKMRTGIKRLAAAYGKMGYHETITEFWLRMVWKFLGDAPENESVTSLTNRLIADDDNKERIYEYYSSDLLNSAEAKSHWVEPDLKPLPITASVHRPASRPASVG